MMFSEINLIDIFEKFGVTLSFLVFFLLAAYRGFCWLGQNIILPLHQRHMIFIDRIEGSIGEVAKAQAESLRILSEVLNYTRTLKKEAKHD